MDPKEMGTLPTEMGSSTESNLQPVSTHLHKVNTNPIQSNFKSKRHGLKKIPERMIRGTGFILASGGHISGG